MEQREVQDDEGRRWLCVQALAGVETADGDSATAAVEDDEGRVPVVCTPSGGAQSVRVTLPSDWATNTDDDELLAAIARERRG